MQLLTASRKFESLVYTVYRTTNLVNGKFYIGYHKTFDLDDGYIGSGFRLHNSIKKYGYSQFKKEILFIFTTSEEAFEKEKELIEPLLGTPLCMNIYSGGSGGVTTIRKGFVRSLETRAKMSASLALRPRSEASCNKISETLKKHYALHPVSEETRQKLSKASTSRVCTEETRQKLRNPSLEAREKMSKATKGIPKSEEHRKKIGESGAATRAKKKLLLLT